MSKEKSSGGGLKGIMAIIVIPVALLIAIVIYTQILGSPSNFQDGDTTKDALEGNYLGIIYKGGIIVPILLTCLLSLLIFTFERFFTIQSSKGTGSMDGFLRQVKTNISAGNIDAAIALCDKQKGSVGNVVKEGLVKYKQVWNQRDLDKDAKLASIQKELEEATTLELPMLQRNLVIISTIASIATLLGLLGTVIGMIKAFAALSNAGAPDASKLAAGISEALINTALGIGTSALAIIFYNLFNNSIDGITFRIDEAGFSIAQNFASTYVEDKKVVA